MNGLHAIFKDSESKISVIIRYQRIFFSCMVSDGGQSMVTDRLTPIESAWYSEPALICSGGR
jgi:hypothetical protein